MSNGFAYENVDTELIRRAASVLRAQLVQRGIGICVSGIDGSGKTTLARTLVARLRDSGIPARHLHPYKWYVNVAVTPFVLLYNRYRVREVLVLDRAIYDNVAVMAAKSRCPHWVLKLVLAATHACYPRFEYYVYLVAGYAETRERRPDTREDRFAQLTLTYTSMMACMPHARLHSDAQSLNGVLRAVATGVDH